MPVYYDQLQRPVELASTPKRIISIVPSQTELLFYLGLDQQIIGITKFCIRPEDKCKHTEKVGGTKQLDIAKIKSLQPDLIIANKEENERSQVEELMAFCPVWISDIADLNGATDMIRKIGEIVGKTDESKELVEKIRRRFDNLSITQSHLHAAYFIWRKPYMVAGKGTFIDSMLQKCGLINAFEQSRYPEIDAEMLVEANPDVVLLSSEPYPFKEKHLAEFRSLLPSAIVMLVDGEIFSWYGNRLLYAPSYFEKVIHELKSVQSL